MGMDWSEEPDPGSHESGMDDGFDDALAEPDPDLGDDDSGDGDAYGDFVFDDEDDAAVEADSEAALEFDDADDLDQSSPDSFDVELSEEDAVGTDPDTPEHQDDPAFNVEFPPDLDLDPRPEPIDGEPWSDSSLLGDVAEPDIDWVGLDAGQSLDDLLAVDATGADTGWDGLLQSSDPAVSSLARWWQP